MNDDLLAAARRLCNGLPLHPDGWTPDNRRDLASLRIMLDRAEQQPDPRPQTGAIARQLLAALKLCAARLEEYPDAAEGIAIEGAQRAIRAAAPITAAPFITPARTQEPAEDKAQAGQDNPQATRRVCMCCGNPHEGTGNVCASCAQGEEP